MPSAAKLIADSYRPEAKKTLIDLTGQRYGRWLVMARAPSERGTKWTCLCDCGVTRAVESPSLRRGKSISCGCVSVVHGDFGQRLYRIWANMLNRCRNKNVKAYADYGARGITVCEAWIAYLGFKEWALANGYADNLTIERENVDGPYEPGNCSWIPRSFQSANRRTIRRDPNGRPWCEIARENGVPGRVFVKRIGRGWSPVEAATRPPKR